MTCFHRGIPVSNNIPAIGAILAAVAFNRPAQDLSPVDRANGTNAPDAPFISLIGDTDRPKIWAKLTGSSSLFVYNFPTQESQRAMRDGGWQQLQVDVTDRDTVMVRPRDGLGIAVLDPGSRLYDSARPQQG